MGKKLKFFNQAGKRERSESNISQANKRLLFEQEHDHGIDMDFEMNDETASSPNTASTPNIAISPDTATANDNTDDGDKDESIPASGTTKSLFNFDDFMEDWRDDLDEIFGDKASSDDDND